MTLRENGLPVLSLRVAAGHLAVAKSALGASPRVLAAIMLVAMSLRFPGVISAGLPADAPNALPGYQPSESWSTRAKKSWTDCLFGFCGSSPTTCTLLDIHSYCVSSSPKSLSASLNPHSFACSFGGSLPFGACVQAECSAIRPIDLQLRAKSHEPRLRLSLNGHGPFKWIARLGEWIGR